MGVTYKLDNPDRDISTERQNMFIKHFDTRNNYKMPDYHRLDFAINFNKKRKKFERTWSIGVYNVYNHRNIFFMYYEDGLKSMEVLHIIPYFSYSFKF